MVFENLIRHHPIQPAKAGFATVARGFSRRAGMRIAEEAYETRSQRERAHLGERAEGGKIAAGALQEGAT